MRIDGKAIADGILNTLEKKIKHLDFQPTLAVILVGDDPASLSYIKQKTKAAERIGAKLLFEHLSATISRETLVSAIARFNTDPLVHGLIVQRPVPIPGIGITLNTVAPEKDVDGFTQNSPFQVPVARAVVTILKNIGATLENKNIVIIGRGETAGKPIAKAFPSATIIHSQTPNPNEIIKSADILISCVGKNVVKNIKPGAILISVGLFRENDGLLHGDYEEEDVKNLAGFYTPTPGGVGPVNVACLMQNLLDAIGLD